LVAGDGFSSVRNLTGHSIEKYNVHAGTSIPNYDSGQTHVLKEGVYAIEPFVTNGAGSVRDGRPSGIYHFSEPRPIRDSTAREVAAFIISEYEGLPFCSRWIHARFGGRGLLALKVLEQAGVLYHYAHLVEIDNGIVAQAEHTLLVEKGKTVVIT
jgi:methionyl aminopeptidase